MPCHLLSLGGIPKTQDSPDEGDPDSDGMGDGEAIKEVKDIPYQQRDPKEKGVKGNGVV